MLHTHSLQNTAVFLLVSKQTFCFGEQKAALTFILKKVMLVSRSTVDLRSWSLSGLLAGKLF